MTDPESSSEPTSFQPTLYDLYPDAYIGADDAEKGALTSTLAKYGVCVVLNVKTTEECHTQSETLLNEIATIFPKVDITNASTLAETFVPKNLPSQTKRGLFQKVLGHFPSSWKIRSDPLLHRLFRKVYKDWGLLHDDERLLCSADAVNLKTNADLFDSEKSRWPHLDFTGTKPYSETRCIQSGVVFSKSTACFECTPKSHMHIEEILDIVLQIKRSNRNWVKFNDKHIENIRAYLEGVGIGEENWQVPVLAPVGSVIFWESSLIHAARFQNPEYDDHKIMRLSAPSYKMIQGWRHVQYVSMRPEKTVNDMSTRRIAVSAFVDGRTSNHWSSSLFGKKGFRGAPEEDETIDAICDAPWKIRQTLPLPRQTFIDLLPMIPLDKHSQLIMDTIREHGLSPSMFGITDSWVIVDEIARDARKKARPKKLTFDDSTIAPPRLKRRTSNPILNSPVNSVMSLSHARSSDEEKEYDLPGSDSDTEEDDKPKDSKRRRKEKDERYGLWLALPKYDSDEKIMSKGTDWWAILAYDDSKERGGGNVYRKSTKREDNRKLMSRPMINGTFVLFYCIQTSSVLAVGYVVDSNAKTAEVEWLCRSSNQKKIVPRHVNTYNLAEVPRICFRSKLFAKIKEEASMRGVDVESS